MDDAALAQLIAQTWPVLPVAREPHGLNSREMAFAIAKAESGGQNEVSPSGCCGPWQLCPCVGANDPKKNAQVAFLKSEGGLTWTAWDTAFGCICQAGGRSILNQSYLHGGFPPCNCPVQGGGSEPFSGTPPYFAHINAARAAFKDKKFQGGPGDPIPSGCDFNCRDLCGCKTVTKADGTTCCGCATVNQIGPTCWHCDTCGSGAGVSDIIGFVTSGKNWARLGMAVGGAVLMVLGIYMIAQDVWRSQAAPRGAIEEAAGLARQQVRTVSRIPVATRRAAAAYKGE